MKAPNYRFSFPPLQWTGEVDFRAGVWGPMGLKWLLERLRRWGEGFRTGEFIDQEPLDKGCLGGFLVVLRLPLGFSPVA